MKHFALPKFWRHYRDLPKDVQSLADDKFRLLKSDSSHPSLHLKRVLAARSGGVRGDESLWSVRIGMHYRALGRDTPEGVVWFWIGTHAEYDRILS